MRHKHSAISLHQIVSHVPFEQMVPTGDSFGCQFDDLVASLVITSRMQQCFNMLIDIFKTCLLLLLCWMLMEINATTTTTTTTTTTATTIVTP